MVVSGLSYSAIVGCKAIQFNRTVLNLYRANLFISYLRMTRFAYTGITVHMKPIKKCTTIVSNLIRSIAIDYKVTKFNVAAF